MKVIVEIPDYMLGTMRGLLMMQVSSDAEAKGLNEAVQRLEAMQEPIEIDMSAESVLFGKGCTKEKNEFPLAVASFAIAQEMAKS